MEGALREVGEKCGGDDAQHGHGRPRASAARNVHLTAYENWHRMPRGYRVRVKPGALVGTAAALRDRLARTGLDACAALGLPDTAVLQGRPGYRLNPRTVHRFTHCPAEVADGKVTGTG
ncbi:hypothetical protein [Streptomyces sp. NPDC002640]